MRESTGIIVFAEASFCAVHRRAPPLEVRLYLPALWLGVMISIVAIGLLYALIARGNLVNVTSLFYLVSILTAGMDWPLFSHAMSILALAGMAAIVVGLILVLGRSPGGQPPATFHSTKR